MSGSAENIRNQLGFTEVKKTILVIGGSQGARNINNHLLEILPTLLHKYQVIHQTGENNYQEVIEKAGILGIKAGHGGYFPLPTYGDEFSDLLAVSDLVISRAGANSISELAATGKASIIIPILSSANDHQRMNAYELAKVGAALVLEENNLGQHMLLEKIEEIMNNDEIRNKMSESIRYFYHADAAEKIAFGILGMVKP